MQLLSFTPKLVHHLFNLEFVVLVIIVELWGLFREIVLSHKFPEVVERFDMLESITDGLIFFKGGQKFIEGLFV